MKVMKAGYVMLFLLALWLPALQPARAFEPDSDYRRVISRANSSGRPIFIEFTEHG